MNSKPTIVLVVLSLVCAQLVAANVSSQANAAATNTGTIDGGSLTSNSVSSAVGSMMLNMMNQGGKLPSTVPTPAGAIATGDQAMLIACS